MTIPGQARERTAISWGRTALGTVALGALLLRLGIEAGSVLEILAAALALSTGAAIGYLGRMSYRWPGSTGSLRAVTIAIVVIGVLAVVGAVTA